MLQETLYPIPLTLILPSLLNHNNATNTITLNTLTRNTLTPIHNTTLSHISMYQLWLIRNLHPHRCVTIMVVNIPQSTRLRLPLSTQMMLPQSSLMGFAEGASTAAPPIPPLGEGRTSVQEKWFVFFFFYPSFSFFNVKNASFFF